MTSRQ